MSKTSRTWFPKRASKRRKAARTELSEAVVRREREMLALVASIRVHKAGVAASLRQRFTPALRAGEAVPDHELTLELAGRSVELAFERLDELDDRHRRLKAERAHAARDVEWVAKQELYSQAVAVRGRIDAAFGRDAGSELHTFTGKTPRATGRLKAHVERAARRLGNPRRELPRGQVAGEPVDRDDWKRRLEGPLSDLVASDDRLSRLTAERDSVRDRRQQAMERFDTFYAQALHLAEAAYRMAGLDKRMVKSLRSGVERRRLALRARKKREARTGWPDASSPAADTGGSLRQEAASHSGFGPVAAVSRWLGRMRVFR